MECRYYSRMLIPTYAYDKESSLYSRYTRKEACYTDRKSAKRITDGAEQQASTKVQFVGEAA